MSTKDLLDNTIQKSLEVSKNDSYEGQDGLLYCNNCHTPKQADIPDLQGGTFRVGVLCECKEAERAEEEKRQRKAEIDFIHGALREEGMEDKRYHGWTFEANDGSYPEILKTCRGYVKQWEKMQRENIGVLFYGGFGVGKTFHAANIGNALIDQGVRVFMSNITALLMNVQDFKKQDYYFQKLERSSFVIIDDIGAERTTSYGLEQVYNIVDTRYRSGKPTIFTTNLSLEEIQNPTEFSYKRIYDRVNEMAPIQLKMAGISKRHANKEARRQQALKLLYEVE